MNKLIFFSCFIFRILIVNSQEKTGDIKYSKIFNLEGSNNTISIYNSNSTAVRFNLKINDVFPLSYSTIQNNIEILAKQLNYPLEKAAWKFVSDNTFFAQPFSNETWQHSPLVFLNSLGGGFCDDRATVLAKIWQNQGFTSRVIGLEGHVVAEVFTDNKWKMFDANNDIFYVDQNKSILSVKELERNVNEINLKNYDSEDINPTFLVKNPISSKLNNCYISDYNNKDQSEWHLNYLDPSLDFELPANSVLEFKYDDLSGEIFVIVKLRKGASGLVQVPLVPSSANGNFSYVLGDSLLKLNGENQAFPKNTNLNVMQISQTVQDSEIQYLVNPKFHFLFRNSTNKLSVSSNGALAFSESSTKQFFHNVETDMYLFFDTKTKENYLFLSKIDAYSDEQINVDFLKKQFSLFLSCDTISSEIQKKDYMLQFEKDYLLLKNQGKGLEELLIKKYPTSMLYFFLASRYRRLDFLNLYAKKKLEF